MLTFSHGSVAFRSTKSSLIRIQTVNRGWTEGKILPICCVCGKEAVYLYHGLWWCERHYGMLDTKGGTGIPAARAIKETAGK
ncbi:hypothetical protein AKJ55_00230 [candidate division MSBL1 archaeon SCGC-AAA382M17]|uniref:Uncharacterized protein n=1 Tax=candidate division MSBL1 archaeon SCGC-AAA382M17 TaxID=1698284 RepID=A0ABR5TK73_9EURY|nr:hypothetical protein AKJ55_00230 [candidate division MSBL1 archaeon SCGC-AAA382M17]